MNVLVSFEIKFKTNRERLIGILKHFAFKRIQGNLYFGDIDYDELFMMQTDIDKTNTFDRNLSFVEDLYRIF